MVLDFVSVDGSDTPKTRLVVELLRTIARTCASPLCPLCSSTTIRATRWRIVADPSLGFDHGLAVCLLNFPLNRLKGPSSSPAAIPSLTTALLSALLLSTNP